MAFETSNAGVATSPRGGTALNGSGAVAAGPTQAPIPVKIVIAGGFGVGKTTMVGAISEISPLSTEAAMTTVGAEVDDATMVSTKTTTTVAMDFGRITIGNRIVLYLFGTPGQDRFGFMWDDLVQGALGAVVLVDSRRIEDAFPALDYFEERKVPFIVAVNMFDGGLYHDLDSVRDALAVDPETPMIATDARNKQYVKDVLIALLERVIHIAVEKART
jgi:signal recognition particle receptor subunit beta